MRRRRTVEPCKRCGKRISQHTDGSGPIAHKCPHGRQCVSPSWGRGKLHAAPECVECGVAQVFT